MTQSFQRKNLTVSAWSGGYHRVNVEVADEGNNVVNAGLLSDLREVLEAFPHDILVTDTVRSNTGFGANIRLFRDMDSEETLKGFSQDGQKTFQLIKDRERPTIAVARGTCLGGSTELLLAHDFRIAVKGAKIGLPECKLGVLPAFNGTFATTALMGSENAARFMLSGQPVDAETAHKLGLIDCIVRDGSDTNGDIAAFVDRVRSGGITARESDAILSGDELNNTLLGLQDQLSLHRDDQSWKQRIPENAPKKAAEMIETWLEAKAIAQKSIIATLLNQSRVPGGSIKELQALERDAFAALAITDDSKAAIDTSVFGDKNLGKFLRADENLSNAGVEKFNFDR